MLNATHTHIHPLTFTHSLQRAVHMLNEAYNSRRLAARFLSLSLSLALSNSFVALRFPLPTCNTYTSWQSWQQAAYAKHEGPPGEIIIKRSQRKLQRKCYLQSTCRPKRRPGTKCVLAARWRAWRGTWMERGSPVVRVQILALAAFSLA